MHIRLLHPHTVASLTYKHIYWLSSRARFEMTSTESYCRRLEQVGVTENEREHHKANGERGYLNVNDVVSQRIEGTKGQRAVDYRLSMSRQLKDAVLISSTVFSIVAYPTFNLLLFKCLSSGKNLFVHYFCCRGFVCIILTVTIKIKYHWRIIFKCFLLNFFFPINKTKNLSYLFFKKNPE